MLAPLHGKQDIQDSSLGQGKTFFFSNNSRTYLSIVFKIYCIVTAINNNSIASCTLFSNYKEIKVKMLTML